MILLTVARMPRALPTLGQQRAKPWQSTICGFSAVICARLPMARRACRASLWGVMSRPRILLVEDEESIAVPFEDALVREGFDPVLATTGADALRLAREESPDLVLLDLGLPDTDGRDVCRALRRESAIPFVIIDTATTETDRIVGLELGADDYVVKP